MKFMARSGPPLRFIADEQLGKLSRWLKILGQDVVYKNRIPDEELIERAKAEERHILTRDSRLPEKACGLPVYLVRENYPALQLKEVVTRFRDRMAIDILSRCVGCNEPLIDVDKGLVAGKVPPYVYKTQDHFRHCTRCGKYFWSATHKDHIEFLARDILGDLYEELAVHDKGEKGETRQ